MSLPNQPVNLLPEQVAELNRKLSSMRHNVNNVLGLITAAVEILQLRPESLEKLLPTLLERPNQIVREIRRFSDDFEETLGITRD